MSKQLICYIAVFAMVFFSCKSEWSAEERSRVKAKCVEVNQSLYLHGRADSICECYLQKLVERYPQNDQRPEDILTIVNECAAEFPLTID